MLNIKLDVAEGIDTFEMEGDFLDLFAEATFVISQIYKQIHKGPVASRCIQTCGSNRRGGR